MEFNEKLQELRKQKGFTQEELAQALYVSRTAVSKWESGRGHPSIESLKAIAKLFGVTVDDLLSGDEVLTIAQAEQKRSVSHIRDLVCGSLDCGSAMFLFLPLFRQTAEGGVQSVPLLALDGIAAYLKVLYVLMVAGMAVWGVLTLALQNCRGPLWVRSKYGVSLALGAMGVLLFVIGMQPYAAAFLFLLLVIKALTVVNRK